MRLLSLIRFSAMRLYPLAVAILAALSYYALEPGVLTFDTRNQLQQIIQSQYTDAHPAIMAWWWGWMMAHLWKNVAVLLVFHLCMFWSGVCIFGMALGRRSPLCAWLGLGIWFLPPMMAMTAVLIKDSGMTCSFMLACAMMLYCNEQPRKPHPAVAVTIVLFLFYGATVRHNGILAALPLCYWFAMTIRVRRRAAAATLLCAGILLVNSAFTASIGAIKITYQDSLYFYDLSGVSMRIHQQLMPPYNQPEHFYNYTDLMDFQSVKDQLLHKAELEMLHQYPMDYLAVRWELFRTLMRIGIDQTNRPFYWYEKSKPSQKWVGNYLKTNADSASYIGIMWFVMEIGVVTLAWRRRVSVLQMQAGLLSVSGILTATPLLLIAPGPPFRYLYWLVASGFWSALITAVSFIPSKLVVDEVAGDAALQSNQQHQ